MNDKVLKLNTGSICLNTDLCVLQSIKIELTLEDIALTVGKNMVQIIQQLWNFTF